LPVKKRKTTFAPASRDTQCELDDAKNKKNTFLDILNWQPFRWKSEQKE